VQVLDSQVDTFSAYSYVKMMFNDFCETTGLHGWKYLTKVESGGKILWLMIVLASLAVATIFLHASIMDFTSSTVVTTIATTTASLSEVYFPSVILCSINQIRKSLFRGLEVSKTRHIELFLQTFYSGRAANLTEEEMEIIQSYATREKIVKKLMLHWHLISDTNSTDRSAPSNQNLSAYLDTWETFLAHNREFIEHFDFIRDLAVEDPGDSPVILAKFGSEVLPQNTTSFLPFFGTDFGLCSVIKPQVTFSKDPSIRNLPWDQKLFAGPDSGLTEGAFHQTFSWNIEKGAKVGKYNGLTLLLDAETFDYMYQLKPSEGFKMSVQHHLDQPLMQINEIDISPGFESQIAVSPTLFTTTKAAQERFSPEERGCYSQREVMLKHLPYGMYRYDIGNCLFEAAYDEVLDRCNCTPYFHWGVVDLPTILAERPFCKGPSLLCMNQVFGQLGEINRIKQDNQTDVQCLAACEDQINQIYISQSKLPNRATLVQRPEFCLVINRLKHSCGGFKYEGIELNYPGLCTRIHSQASTALCSDNKSEDDQIEFDKPAVDLVNQIYRYSRDNLALVNVYIKNPVVTKIRRDQKIPLIWFVANSGGILGLCMGFSMVTVFEVLHYIGSCVVKIIKMKIMEEKEETRRKKDKEHSFINLGGKEETEKTSLTLALTPETPGSCSFSSPSPSRIPPASPTVSCKSCHITRDSSWTHVDEVQHVKCVRRELCKTGDLSSHVTEKHTGNGLDAVTTQMHQTKIGRSIISE